MSSNRRRLAARRRNKDAGSPIDSEPVFISVGIARRPHGLRGEALVRILTEFPERLQPGVQLYLGEKHQPVTIASRRQHKDGLLMAFEEFESREAWDHLRNVPLFVKTEDRPDLEEGEFYHHQLLGLEVVDEEGQVYGRIGEILETGANDVYIVRTDDDQEVLFPATEEVVLKVDLEQKQVLIRPLPGLLPDQE